jgi:tol-pal system protein YbgF
VFFERAEFMSMRTLTLSKVLTAAALATAFSLSLAPAAWPKGDEDLADKLDRVERDLRELQFEVYKGNPPAATGGQAGAPMIGGVGSSAAKLNDMEDSLRELRGQVESLTFQVKQLTEQLALARKETDYRLGALEGGAPASAINSAVAAAPAAPAAGGPLATMPKAAGAPAALASKKPGGTLGSIPADAVSADAGGPTPQQQYDGAVELLSRAQYSEAQTAFRTFVAANPTDQLAGPAQFWVGDIAFTQKDYQGSAKAFAEVLKRYGKTPKAPEAMLKLGLSLLQLNQKKEGCTTLGALKVKYPAAKKEIDRARARAAEAGCAAK